MLKAIIATVCALSLVAPAWAASEVEVEINGGVGPLKGSITWPDGNAPVPAVLILPGSGPTDRNGNAPGGLNTNAYRLIAEAFASGGTASLRIDKRGIAGSASAMVREEELRFETYIEDARAWIRFLRSQKRISRIYVLGHSEGALIGSVAAQGADVAGFISLSGAGFKAAEILRRQLAGQIAGDLKTQAFHVLDELEAGRLVANPPPALASLFRTSVQPYLVSWFRYDPATEVARIKGPVMIIQGTTDLQVTVGDARKLAAGRPDAQLRIIEGMNHVLRAASMDRAENVATYANPALPLKPELMPMLQAFVGR